MTNLTQHCYSLFLYFGYKPPRCRPPPPTTPHLGLISMWFVVFTTLLSFLFPNLNPSTHEPPPPPPPTKNPYEDV